ncbi:NADH:flavin oxidoreductase/NADH oxidase family protein [Nereida sp. MMG025]|uniref:NADH:flavin oxidoreductase/NADH oxidase family protein n=1 Tax=Nereida sp. MMG025 TaxID=2909981 RepID=UPI001F473DB9|nr:NADH:flavin oxidoreductase/NADH oxidase family protein [Nereida sp. MMG025]MCF6443963.1 NADH:flavin oxidoreductase/NADH oxidase family protein [Nereida sp. MMG025]
MAPTALNTSLTLPCGAVVPNRLAKAALSEGLADGTNQANARFTTLYEQWGKGGAGMLITGNVIVDRWHLERGGNLAIDGDQSNVARAALSDMAAAGKAHGSLMVMQLNHAGRQTQKAINPHPKGASDVGLKMGNGRFATPTPMSDADIEDMINRFVAAAKVAMETGFDGVQVHAAHGYLMSQFLSALSNTRTDGYGGDLAARAKPFLQIVSRIRATCPAPFIVGVKLNSADFQKGGFSQDDSAQVAAWLEAEGADFIEVSGGNYEQPRMIDFDRKDPKAVAKRESTAKREAYFLDFVPKLRAATSVPVMVTGGFRSAAAMERAVQDDGVDLIGLGRPLLLDTDAANKLLTGEIAAMDSRDHDLVIGKGLLGPTSPISFLRDLNAWGALGWYYEQTYRLADGKAADKSLSPFKALLAYDKTEKAAAKALTGR